MPRPLHIISGSDILRTRKTLGTGTSGHETEEVTVDTTGLKGFADLKTHLKGELKGTFYLKHSASKEIAQIEALALIITGTPLNDVFLYKTEKGEHFLLTKDNKFKSCHDLFDGTDGAAKEFRETQEEQIACKPTPTHLQSLVQVLIYIILLGDDDCHARNLGLSHDLKKFIRIDEDRILFLILEHLVDQRDILTDSSAKGCFELTHQLIDAYIEKTPPLPHYHPLKVSSTLTTSRVNRYDPGIQSFFSALYQNKTFNMHLVAELIRISSTSIETVKNSAALFGLDESLEEKFFTHYQDRLDALYCACQQSQQAQCIIANTNALSLLEDKLKEDFEFKTKVQGIILEKTQQTILKNITRYHFLAIVNLIKKHEIPDQPCDHTNQLLRILQEAVEHNHTYEELFGLYIKTYQLTQNISIKSKDDKSLINTDLLEILKQLKSDITQFETQLTFDSAHILTELDDKTIEWIEAHTDHCMDIVAINPDQNGLDMSVMKVSSACSSPPTEPEEGFVMVKLPHSPGANQSSLFGNTTKAVLGALTWTGLFNNTS